LQTLGLKNSLNGYSIQTTWQFNKNIFFVLFPPKYKIIQLAVFNHSGQLVYKADASSTTYNLSVGSFESGLYLFRVTTAEGTTTKRIVIN
jgi:hypothetical protein